MGALAPLLDVQFFERVFIDYGAVAWPGEIDLAPDAMYAQVSRRLFSGLRRSPAQAPSCLETFALWEKELQDLDFRGRNVCHTTSNMAVNPDNYVTAQMLSSVNGTRSGYIRRNSDLCRR
jgi:hypothetical protein